MLRAGFNSSKRIPSLLPQRTLFYASPCSAPEVARRLGPIFHSTRLLPARRTLHAAVPPSLANNLTELRLALASGPTLAAKCWGAPVSSPTSLKVLASHGWLDNAS